MILAGLKKERISSILGFRKRIFISICFIITFLSCPNFLFYVLYYYDVFECIWHIRIQREDFWSIDPFIFILRNINFSTVIKVLMFYKLINEVLKCVVRVVSDPSYPTLTLHLIILFRIPILRNFSHTSIFYPFLKELHKR